MPQTIHVAHSPDSDDAFMFYALAEGQIDTQGLSYVHELQDIETLNGRAMRGELDVTAVSIHAYAYLSDRYALLPHGASMGDGYGPMLVSRQPMTKAEIVGRPIAVPGMMTSAYLALKLFQPDFIPIVVPFEVGNLVHDLGFRSVHELGYWESFKLGPLKVTLTPCAHWGARVLHDSHRGFGGFIIEHAGRTIYHCGGSINSYVNR